MAKYYFDVFVKRVAFVGIEADDELSARKLFDEAMGDWQFARECFDLAESMEPCDEWHEFYGQSDDPDYGDADMTDYARERAAFSAHNRAAKAAPAE